jgi:hypothetical protein
MRFVKFVLAGLPLLFASTAIPSAGCGGANNTGFGDSGGGGGSGGGGDSSLTDSGGQHHGDSSYGEGGLMLGDGSGSKDGTSSGDVIVTTTTTVYANTDTALYSLDPKTNAVTLIGTFAGMGGDGGDGATVTDCAVDAEGDVYVNTESAVFKAVLPATSGTVNLSPVATITTGKDQYFYALAFAPKGFLGSGETLIGGDNIGSLYAINTTSGTLINLGNFGGVPGSTSGEIFALSGDMVFYTDSTGKATGLATIRECEAGGKDCTKTNDYLAGIDMSALQTAYTSMTPAPSLLGGIYGGSSTAVGSGTNYGEIFGLGAWEGNVYGFSNAYKGTSASIPPYLLNISTTTGAATIIPETFPFTSDGWAGAGVTTTVKITIPPPPPPPPQPH